MVTTVLLLTIQKANISVHTMMDVSVPSKICLTQFGATQIDQFIIGLENCKENNPAKWHPLILKLYAKSLVQVQLQSREL